MKLAVFLLLLAISFVACEQSHFRGYSVLKYEITDGRQMEIITDIGVDVWSHDSNLVFGINDIMVSASQKAALARRGIYHKEVMVADVEQRIADERQNIERSLSAPQADFFDDYHNFDEISKYYQDLATQYPSLVTFITSIGKTIEGVDIPAVTIGKSTTNKIFIQGGQHAREWIGPATAAYIATQLVSNSTAKTIVDQIQFVIVPVVNVDGYKYTWTTNRLWRKNRRANTGGSYGVDLNRNWNDHWGGSGSSGTPSSDTYRGTAPFSEPETKAVSAFFQKFAPFAGAIDYHSYGQLILRPYGWSSTLLPPNDAYAKAVGDGYRDAIRATTGVQYTSQSAWQLYSTDGTARDWFSNTTTGGKSPLGYTIELRDTGTYGFQLPAAQIRPTGQENWVAFKFLAEYILSSL